MGILHEVQINDPFYDITVEKISERVLANKNEIELKVSKKLNSENQYYD